MPHDIGQSNAAADWEAIYEADDARWDLGGPAPPFVDLLAAPPDWLTPGTMLVPGCGRGHDAVFFAERGYGVTAMDFAPSAAAAVYERAEAMPSLRVVLGDVLDPPENLVGLFDYVLEHTFFCTLPSAERQRWLAAMRQYLKPEGVVFGLFYRFDDPDDKGPPYVIDEHALNALVTPYFDIIEWHTPEHSSAKRQGRERMIALRQKVVPPPTT